MQPSLATEGSSFPARLRPNLTSLGLAIILIGYFAFLVSHASYAIGGVDESGYINLARSILRGQVKLDVSEVDTFGLHESIALVFVPVAYIHVNKDGNSTRTAVPLYPIGFPLHEVAAALVAGWRVGPFLVSPLLAVLSCWLVYCIGLRLGLSRWLAVGAALLLAVNPTLNLMAMQPGSDATSLFWAVFAFWAALRSCRNGRWAMLAGFAFGMAFLVRPTNILVLLPLAFCIPLEPRRIILFAIGGLPVAAVFLGYNYAVFGNPLQTGYGSMHLWYEFTIDGAAKRLSYYLYWISATMSPILLIGWLSVAFFRSVDWWKRAVLISWFAVFLLVYSSYSYFYEWWSTRFVLPAYPVLVLGTMLTAQSLGVRLTGVPRIVQRTVASAILIVLFAWPLYFDYREGFTNYGDNQLILSESCRWADKHLPPHAVVVSMQMSGALRFYTARSIIRWDYIVPWFWPTLRQRVLESGYSFYGLLMDAELERARRGVPGYWTEVRHFGHIGLWRIEPLDAAPPEINFVSGFYDTERSDDGSRNWRWMSKEGLVRLQNTGRDMKLVIEGDVPVEAFARRAAIKFVVNGAELESLVTRERPLRREYRVTAEQQGKGDWSELRMVVDQDTSPAEKDPRSQDRRRLSFSLSKLRWNEP